MQTVVSWAQGVLAAAGLDEVVAVVHVEEAGTPGVLVLAVNDEQRVEVGRIHLRREAGPDHVEARAILQAAMKVWLPPYPCAVLPPGPVAAVHRAMSDAALAHMSGADATAPLRTALTTLTALLAERPLPTRRGA